MNLFLKTSGVIFLVLILLSFTDLPYYAYHHLGTVNAKLIKKPEVIILLGGSGMPSPDGLIRTYYAADLAEKFTEARIIIALPYNEHETDSLYQLNLMANELILKGINPERITYEPKGYNTRSQALNIAAMYGEHKPVLALVTSPEHIYRSIKTFEKAGFSHVGGVPSFEKPPEEDKIKDKNAKDQVNSLSVRYNMWSYLSYEILVLREYTAIAYYKCKGWI
ncbi:MAG: YdcF family protein [Cytophagaceae bacterium]